MAYQMLASIASDAGSSIIGGFFAANQYKNEAAVAKYNAAVLRMQAEAVRIRTRFQQKRQAEAAARTQGELRAAIGGSGIVATQGAPLLSLALQKSESELENYLIGYEGIQQAQALENQALEYDMRKKQLRNAGKQSIFVGFLGAGSTGLQGLSSMPKTQATQTSTDSRGFSTGYTSTATPGAGRM